MMLGSIPQKKDVIMQFSCLKGRICSYALLRTYIKFDCEGWVKIDKRFNFKNTKCSMSNLLQLDLLDSRHVLNKREFLIEVLSALMLKPDGIQLI